MSDEKRAPSCAEAGHAWRILLDGSVSCARCYQCLGVERLLAAYLKQNPKDSRYP